MKLIEVVCPNCRRRKTILKNIVLSVCPACQVPMVEEPKQPRQCSFLGGVRW